MAALVSVVASFAQAQSSEVLYVYRNDGAFDAFYYSDVDSITYSNRGVDGYSYDDIVTQEVWAADGLHRIPLAAIDSIGFAAPPTIVNSDVFEFTAEHDPYLSETSTLGFTMSLSTPADMRPGKGAVVVGAIDCMAFPDGIMARVISITEMAQGYRYECEKVGLDEVYDQVVAYYDAENGETPKTRLSVNLEKELWNIPYDKEWEISGTTTALNANDRGYLRMKVCKLLTSDFYAEFSLNNDFTSSLSFSAEVEGEAYPSKELLNISVGRIPTSVPLLWIVPKLKLIGYAEMRGRAGLQFDAHLNRSDAVAFRYEDKQWKIFHNGYTDAGVDVAELSMEGQIEVGVQPEILLSVSGLETGLGVTSRFGVKQTAEFYFDALKYFDTGTYDAIKDSKVKTYATSSVSGFAAAGIIDEAVRGELPLTASDTLLSEKYLVPDFTEQYQQNVDGPARVVGLGVYNDVIVPVNISMGLYDANDQLLYEVDDGDKYDGTAHDYRYNLGNVDAYPGCKAHPIIRFGKIEMRAMPEIELVCPATVDKAELLEALYNPDRANSNMFRINYTATLEDMTDVEEWGLYVYESLFPFEEVAGSQSYELFLAVPDYGNGIRADYSNFVFEFDDFVGVYVKKRAADGSTKVIRAPYEKHSIRYDTKPSAVISNPVLTGTDIIDTDTDSDGNTIYRYRTNCALDVTVTGALWISYIDSGISGGNWSITEDHPWTPERDDVFSNTWYSTYWSNSETINHSNWYNLHIRNTSRIVTSNALNWYGAGGMITGVDVTQSPMFAPQPGKQRSSRKAKGKWTNYVEEASVQEQRASKAREIDESRVIDYSEIQPLIEKLDNERKGLVDL